MQTVKVRASTEYDVLIERGILKRAGELIKEYTGAGRALLITDRTVDGLYSKAALESLKSAGISCEKFVFEDGEEHKSLKTVGDILSFYASVQRIGNTSITICVEVYAETFSDQGRYLKVTDAMVTYVAIDEEGRPRSIPRESETSR